MPETPTVQSKRGDHAVRVEVFQQMDARDDSGMELNDYAVGLDLPSPMQKDLMAL